MPIYEYRCDQGHQFEIRQRMVDDPVTTCVTCEAPVQRVFSPVAVHFKGSGFYNTDYGKRKRGESTETGKDSGGGDSSDGGGDKKAKDSKSSGSATAASSSGSGSGGGSGSGSGGGSD